jgi:hypothetical protein
MLKDINGETRSDAATRNPTSQTTRQPRRDRAEKGAVSLGVDRRSLLKYSGAAGAAFALGSIYAPAVRAANRAARPTRSKSSSRIVSRTRTARRRSQKI